jgi:hypothetical protein
MLKHFSRSLLVQFFLVAAGRAVLPEQKKIVIISILAAAGIGLAVVASLKKTDRPCPWRRKRWRAAISSKK